MSMTILLLIAIIATRQQHVQLERMEYMTLVWACIWDGARVLAWWRNRD